MAQPVPQDDRYQELLAARVIEGLSPAEQEELEQFSSQYPDFEGEEIERVAASITLAGLRIEPMPAELRGRVEADAEAWFKRPAATVSRLPERPRTAAARGGWLAAAAALVLAVLGWWPAEQPCEPDVAPAQLLAELEARPGTRVIPWSATDDPASGEAGGAVLWNPAAQLGLMRFEGLQPNNPAEAQYQLWIFDAERDERYPVDGGVFDVPAGADEVLVPIRARLPVGEAVLFAITVEEPGGVVVSSRERIALVAQPGA